MFSQQRCACVQDILIQDLERLRGDYATLQQHYKQASLDLMQARLVVKNIGDASTADAALVAAADASDAVARAGNRAALTEAAAAAAGGGAASTSGSVTPPVWPVSEVAPSAADGQSSASSYLPIGLAQALGGGGARGGGGALPATMQLSAQLANAHVKLKVERHRADAAEAQVRKLQQQLAVASGGPAAAINTPLIRDKLTGVLQVRPAQCNNNHPGGSTPPDMLPFTLVGHARAPLVLAFLSPLACWSSQAIPVITSDHVRHGHGRNLLGRQVKLRRATESTQTPGTRPPMHSVDPIQCPFVPGCAFRFREESPSRTVCTVCAAVLGHRARSDRTYMTLSIFSGVVPQQFQTQNCVCRSSSRSWRAKPRPP